MRIGQKIRQFRRDRGWSQQDLADTADTHQHTVCTWEQGKVKSRRKSIEKICEAMHVSIDDFMN